MTTRETGDNTRKAGAPWFHQYVALDLETSGLSPQYDQVLQVAVVPMEAGQIIGEPYYKRVLPLDKFRISREALAAQIGEVTPDTLKKWWEDITRDGEESREVLEGLRQWALDGGYDALPVVAHNASFDWGFFNQWVYIWRVRMGHRSPLGPLWICTKETAQRHPHFAGARSFNLDIVSQGLGMPPRPKAHDALQDAILAGQVYHALTSGEIEWKKN